MSTETSQAADQAPPCLVRRIRQDDHEWSVFASDGAEPLIQDTELAEQLGFSRPRNIRKLIERYASDLGEVCYFWSKPGSVGRPSCTYYLNEFQALMVCGRSDTPKATRVLKAMVAVFMLARQGKLAEAQDVAQTETKRAQQEDKLDRVLDALAGVTAVMGQFMQAMAQQDTTRALPAPAPAALPPASEWLNTANLCAHLSISVSALNKKLRLRNKQAVDLARKWTKHDGYHWNVEAVRALLRGPIPERKWEPPAPVLPPMEQTATPRDLRRVAVQRMNDLCAVSGMESSDGRRLQWRTAYGSFAKRVGWDPMSDARDKEIGLDVIERRGCMPTFLNVVEDLIKDATMAKATGAEVSP